VTANRVPLVWVDAFSDGPFTGNPAAVLLLEREAPEDAMQSLAFELGLSETAFVWPDVGGFSLRWFTPVTEVELCGHATLAAAHVLSSAGLLEGASVRFSTKSGWLEATVDGGEIEIDLPAQVPSAVDVPAELATRWPTLAAASGRFDLVVELESEEAVRRADPREVALATLPYRGVSITARGDTADYVLRFFAPRVGVPEDPVTGSAQCLLGPYWARVLGKSRLAAVQLSSRRGILGVRVDGTRVGVAGRAATVLSGTLSADAARRLVADS
jgi:PhzF family phenazine biosynthesis protein